MLDADARCTLRALCRLLMPADIADDAYAQRAASAPLRAPRAQMLPRSYHLFDMRLLPPATFYVALRRCRRYCHLPEEII